MTTVDEAAELLKVVGPALLIAQVICLPYGFKTISDPYKITVINAWLAICSAMAAIVASLITIVVMWPTTYAAVLLNHGPLNGVLVAFVLLFFFFVGCIVVGFALLTKAAKYYRKAKPRRSTPA